MFAASVVLVAALAADAPVKVAALELKATGVDDVVVKNLSDLFTSELGKVKGYKVIGNTEIQDMIGFEVQKQTLGCTEASCFSEIGGALGVDLIVSGSIGRVGETFVVNVRLIDIKKNETKNRVGESIAGRVELLPDYMRVLAWQLFSQSVPAEVQAAFDATKKRLDEETKVVTAAPVGATASTPVAAAPAAAVTQPVGTPWQKVAKNVATAVAVLGILGGAGLTVGSYLKSRDVGAAKTLEGGRKLYDASQIDAQGAVTFRDYSYISFGVGGVGLVAAIVFAVLQPNTPAATTSVQATPTGFAVTF